MYYIFLALTGVLSGVLGGMGMGGGTLLIPLLTLLFGFNQKIAQGINLVAFSIMAIIVIFVHIKNKLIDIKVALKFGLVAASFSCFGAFLANMINVRYLKVCFGVLLILVAIYETVEQIKAQYFTKSNYNEEKIVEKW